MWNIAITDSLLVFICSSSCRAAMRSCVGIPASTITVTRRGKAGWPASWALLRTTTGQGWPPTVQRRLVHCPVLEISSRDGKLLEEARLDNAVCRSAGRSCGSQQWRRDERRTALLASSSLAQTRSGDLVLSGACWTDNTGLPVAATFSLLSCCGVAWALDSRVRSLYPRSQSASLSLSSSVATEFQKERIPIVLRNLLWGHTGDRGDSVRQLCLMYLSLSWATGVRC